MKQYGTADLIHDILERQGLVWLLENLAHEDHQNANVKEDSGAEAECVDGKCDNVPKVNDDTQCVITENGADQTYFMDSGPGTFHATFTCNYEITCMNLGDSS